MIKVWAILGAKVLGILFVFYLAWKEISIALIRLAEATKGSYLKTTVEVFWLVLVRSLGLGIVMGRLYHMWSTGTLQDTPWGIYPFVVDGGTRVWFVFMPYRILRVGEGINWLVALGSALVVYLFVQLRVIRNISKIELTSKVKEEILKHVIKSALLVAVVIFVLIAFSLG